MSQAPRWTTPEDIRAQLLRVWDSGRILSSALSEAPVFPLSLRVRGPERAELSARFTEAREWVRAWEAESQTRRGSSLQVEWTEVRHRQLGETRLPHRVVVSSRESALALLRKTGEAQRYDDLVSTTLSRAPELREWMTRHPHVLLDRAEEWAQVLDVLDWFRAHPRSGRYLRQVNVPGMDSKFIEHRKGLFSALLDRVLPSAREGAEAPDFESRFGLRAKPARVRFRFLDPALYLHGLSDLTVNVGELAALNPRAEQVFITENEVPGLVFPDVPRGLVIFGLGYSVELLGALPWLSRARMYYWGDIDTHGFAILDALRAVHPHVRSMLMDHDVFQAHQANWSQEDSQHLGALTRLVAPEASLFEDLQHQRFGARLRLEQEHLGYRWVENALAHLSF
ncbi:DUF3322 domain-containing protein [Myxococcus landrumensis]|uniref:Wadjet protein JetD C-terminal domain-containing protein n=1 Tax=Myxococcus landrumensis TaxID=2813577 RepID=A0ABX7N7X9_9BACT|nr:DUF3322 domain-containing protein [Myxococcus landrumus]QSQ14835.1 hypothetical protein JY572_01715 [Myxococcus landrumus]